MSAPKYIAIVAIDRMTHFVNNADKDEIDGKAEIV